MKLFKNLLWFILLLLWCIITSPVIGIYYLTGYLTVLISKIGIKIANKIQDNNNDNTHKD